MNKLTSDEFLNILDILKDLSKITNKPIEKIIDEILKLSDDKIREIIKIDNPCHKEIKIYMYLKKNELPQEVKELLNKSIEEKNYKINDILKVIEKLIKENRKTEIVKYINAISDAKSVNSASWAENIILDPKTYAVENRTLFVETIANAQSNIKAEYGSMAARNENILSHEDALEIVDAIVNTKEDYQSIYAYHVARREDVLKRNDALCLVKSIALTKNIYEAEYIYNLIRNEELITREDLLLLISSIKKAKTKDEIKEIYMEIITKYTENTPILTKRRLKA